MKLSAIAIYAAQNKAGGRSFFDSTAAPAAQLQGQTAW